MKNKIQVENQVQKKFWDSFLYFFKDESASGVILLICAVIAIILANSDFVSAYENILHTNITVGYKEFSLSMSFLHWINDGLMTIFFFVVGMEIKREMLIGELKSIKKSILPIAAALGGMIVPAVIYALFNFGQSSITGFGIPMATDIAFSLAVISLVRKKAPKGIVIFLTALAIVDDLGAILVIAIFYTNELSWMYLFAGLMVFAVLMLANKLKVKSPMVFIMLGGILWVAMLKSGMHATIAGVLLGMAIPAEKDIKEFKKSMLHKFEHRLLPWSSFVIMPIFALANSGISVNVNSISTIISTTVSWGIIFGLFLGKQLGIFGVTSLLVKIKIASLPSQVTKKHLYGASVLGGIGFTMSLFVTSLSFSDEIMISSAKISIIAASLLSAAWGMTIFKLIKTQGENESNLDNGSAA